MAAAPLSEAVGNAVSLSYRHIFGLRSEVRDNIHYIDETSVLYPVGHAVVIYAIDSKSQRVFPGHDQSAGTYTTFYMFFYFQ